MYTREDALRDTAMLHRLEKKKQQAVMEIDAEIEELKREIDYLEDRKKAILAPIESDMEFIKHNLIAWHQEELDNGGEKTIKLPYANLKSRTQPQDYTKDDNLLLEWVKANAPEYMKIPEPAIAWGELKKNIAVSGNVAVFKDTGEVINGLTPKVRETTFDVEVL